MWLESRVSLSWQRGQHIQAYLYQISGQMFLISFLQSTAFTVYQLHVIGWKEWGEIITYIKDDKVALKAKKLPTYRGEIEGKKEFFFKKCFTFYSISLILSTFVCYCILWVKGTVPRVFGLQVFMNQFPPKPLSIPLGRRDLQLKVQMGKIFNQKRFFYFVWPPLV